MMVLLVSCTLLVVSLFSIDLYNPSLPAIAESLNVGQITMRSLVIAYLSGFAFSQLFYGPISDRFGRKKVIFISLTLIILGNGLTALAVSGDQLLVYRFLTGIGAGGCPVVSRAILRDFFQDKKTLTKAFSIFAMAAQISPAFAPVIGGFIEQHYSWRINFLFLAVLTGIALLIVASIFKETNLRKKKSSISFILIDYKSLLLDKRFISYSVMSALVFSYTIAYYTINPFVFQEQYQFTPLMNGIIYMIYSAGLFIGAYSNRKLVNFFNPENILNVSVRVLILAPFVMLFFSYLFDSFWVILLFSTVIAIACGFAAPVLLSLSILPFSEKAGMASALQGAIKMTGTAITLLMLLVFHIDSGMGLSLAFFVISLLFIPFIYASSKSIL